MLGDLGRVYCFARKTLDGRSGRTGLSILALRLRPLRITAISVAMLGTVLVGCTDEATVREVKALREDLRVVLDAVAEVPAHIPTAVPQPTATPQPTTTPQPTATPMPTPAPSADPTEPAPKPSVSEIVGSPPISLLLALPDRLGRYERGLEVWLGLVNKADANREPLPSPDTILDALNRIGADADNLRTSYPDFSAEAGEVFALLFNSLDHHDRFIRFIQTRHNFSDELLAAGAVWVIDQENALRLEIRSSSRLFAVSLDKFVRDYIGEQAGLP